MEEAKLVCHRSRSDKADFEMEIKALWRGKWQFSLTEEILTHINIIDLHLGVLALFQPGTSEVKLSDSYSLKEFVFMLKFSQNRKFPSRNEQNSGIHGLFVSQLQSSNSLLTWTAGKV